MRNKRWLLITLALTLLAAPLSMAAGVSEVLAKVTRVAVVKELNGTVNVKKSGGSKSFGAFKNMSLNEGDTLTTGRGAKVVLELASDKAAQDKITVGENAQVDFTKLSDINGSKTKMNVWAGSMWVKVKSISNASDTFEVETPTAIMGVRGTQFLVNVDRNTGSTNLFVASGIVRNSSPAFAPADPSAAPPILMPPVDVYPGIQMSALTQTGEPKTVVAPIDEGSFITNTPAELIEEVLKDAADIQKENDELVQSLNNDLSGGNRIDQNLEISNNQDLSRYNTNLDNLLGNIAKTAIDNNKISKDKAQEIINAVNTQEQPNRPISIVDTVPKILTPSQQQKQEQLKQLEAERQKQLEEERRKQQEAAQQLQSLLGRIKAEKEALEEANRLAQEAAKKAAEEALLAKLTEAEKQKFEENKKANTETSTTTPESNTEGESSAPEVQGPKAELSAASTLITASQEIALFVLSLNLSGFTGANAIAGYQVKVEYEYAPQSVSMSLSDQFSIDPLAYRSGTTGGFVVEPEGMQVAGANSVDHFTTFSEHGTSSEKGLLLYSVVKFAGNSVAIDGRTAVVKLPFSIYTGDMQAGQSYQIPFRIAEIIAVDKNGNKIADISHSSVLTIQVTNKRSLP